MKANCEVQMASKHSENKVFKSRGKDRDVTHEEMQSLLTKLKDLVPNVPRNRKLSKLEIIQYVIDYILDLQIALETHPAVTRPVSATLAGISPCRQPLGVLPPSANTCTALEVNQIVEKIPTHLGEAISTTRPVSC